MSRKPLFATIRTEGGLLPSDVLARVSAGDQDLAGLAQSDYHLAKGERLGEAITRSWNRLTGAYAAFASELEKIKSADPATGLTRERFLLPLLSELGFGRLPAAKGIDVDGTHFPISHTWGALPIHLVGANIDLDRRTAGVAGAARTSPHSLVQDVINRSDDHLWGMVSNGRQLRLLRDNSSLTRQAYIEFDLQAMFEGEVYADFVVLWMTCHVSRFEGDRPEYSLIEQWSQAATAQGTRALEQLRDGVEKAITALGHGFLVHPANQELRESLRSGRLDKQDYYRQLLRQAYRLLFLFTAEDRDLLHLPDANSAARKRYADHYSTARLRSLAERRRGSAHPDLWRGLKVVANSLGGVGLPPLGLPALGSYLWSKSSVADIADCDLANRDLMAAVFALGFVRDTREKVARAIDYRNLGAEELGSVYESLLELHPEVELEAPTFRLSTAAGHERKVTGSYYTPTSLITSLLDSALDPLLDEAVNKDDPEAAILGLKVCDPACGSGHFLIAAANRIARRLAMVRTSDPEPGPAAMRTALRDVIGHCIYGIDMNTMAVELCKVSLWLEALQPGRPLSFLDHRIACGNSLLGTTPRLLTGGIPDEAFKALTGDDKKVVAELKKRNKLERGGQGTFDLAPDIGDLARPLADELRSIDAIDDSGVEGIRQKEQRWHKFAEGAEATHAKLVADAWCAAFVLPKRKGETPITQDTLNRLVSAPERVPAGVRDAVAQAAEQFGFLHWHLAFPDVFSDGAGELNPDTGWHGGFDLICGNPPWEKVQLEERQFFATRASEIAAAPGAKRKRMIERLQSDDPPLYHAYRSALRVSDAESHLLRSSGRYPMTGQGRINTYAVFAEAMRHGVGPTGRVGCIVPSGIATDDTTKFFFQDLVKRRSLVSLFDFENRKKLFPDVDSRVKFCLLTLAGLQSPTAEAEFVFFAHSTADLADRDRRFTLTPDDFALLNPNTLTCPIFRSQRDAAITKKIYRNSGVLIDESKGEEGNPWGISFMQGLFNMTSDSHLFRIRDELEADDFTSEGNIFVRDNERYLPLYEAKMIHHYNHRFGDYAMQPAGSASTQLPDIPETKLADPSYAPLARYWVAGKEVEGRLADRWERDWLLGWRRIARTTDERTLIATIIPASAVGDSVFLILPDPGETSHLLPAVLCSASFDFAARQKVGGTNASFFIVEQLPALSPATFEGPCPWQPRLATADWLRDRVLELTYTAHDMAPFARDLGYHGPPFRWDPDRRAQLRAELDACFFHLYGLDRDEVDYIMDTFPIVRRKDERAFGEYRTKRLILEIYDAMARAIATGGSYQTVLDPPPADPSVAHTPLEAVPAAGHVLEIVRSPPEEAKHKEVAPLTSLKAAAGAFGDVQQVEEIGWVQVPNHKVRYGMFVAQVVGKSMEPRIPSGSYCLFRYPAGSQQGNIVLAQHHEITDPEHGGSYTVKRYHSEKKYEDDGTWSHTEIRLEPLNAEFPPIIIREAEEGELKIIAELVDVYPEMIPPSESARNDA